MDAFSSDEAKHPASSAQQGLRVKHMLEGFMSDIVKESVCCTVASLILERCLFNRAHPADVGSCTGAKPPTLALWTQGMGQATQLGRGV